MFKYIGSVTRAGKRLRYSKPKCVSIAPELKRHQTNCLAKLAKGLIFRDIEFLLTGFSIQKEKELEGIIRKYGGIVLRDIPSPPNSRGKRISRFKFQQLPIVLCFRKVGCLKQKLLVFSVYTGLPYLHFLIVLCCSLQS